MGLTIGKKLLTGFLLILVLLIIGTSYQLIELILQIRLIGN